MSRINLIANSPLTQAWALVTKLISIVCSALLAGGLLGGNLALAQAQEITVGKTETFEDRAKLIMKAALADEAKLTGGSPMHFWIAQRLFEQGEKDKAIKIVQSGLKAARDFIEKREREKHNNIGYNGFIYWSALNCYVHWHKQFPQALLEDYRYVFTHAHNYKGTTGNLSMIHTLALMLADKIWGAENLPADGNYGARGPKAVKWMNERIKRIAKNGSGEFASRPYMIYNVGTLLTLTNEFIDESLRQKAAMAYEMSIAHAAGTWLRGHWAVPSGRSYPDRLTQQPSGSAGLLWTYFGGVPPRLDAGSSAIFSAAEKFRPDPIVIKAATDRSQPYVCRSRWDGDKLFQTTFMNKSYAVFSTAVLPGGQIWGQTYPYGVMWDEPNVEKASHLWITVPIDDETRLGYHTHGINGRVAQFAQSRGSFVMLAHQPADPKGKYPHALAFIPGGWQAVVNDSQTTGRIFLHYGSVLIALTASEPFTWDVKSGVRCGSPNKEDSEFRIQATTVAIGLETALPVEFKATTPAEQLAAFRDAVLKKSSVKLNTQGAAPTVAFTDHEGTRIERDFGGDTRINGTRVAYETWPLLENPWMEQAWGGNLILKDGKRRKVYDLDKWTLSDWK